MKTYVIIIICIVIAIIISIVTILILNAPVIGPKGTRDTKYTESVNSGKKGIYATTDTSEYYTPTLTTTALQNVCYNSKIVGKNEVDDDYCRDNLQLQEIFITYCENNPSVSPSQYGENDCPGRNKMVLFENGEFTEPNKVFDNSGNHVKLKDLSFDVGIDIVFNGKEVKMNDVHVDQKEQLDTNIFLFKINIGKSRIDPIKPGRCEFHFIICENL